jgi:hypothetical protein
MATTSTYLLRRLKTKNLLNKTENNVSTTKKPIDPFQKRLNHIRINILNNKKQPKVTHAEPTLVFDQFLYLGGIQSLQNKVNCTFLSFIYYSFLFSITRLVLLV